MPASPLSLAPIPPGRHEAFLAAQPAAPFLQLPAWAAVKPGWTAESLGWTTPDGTLAAAALVLYRRVPGTRLRLAYVPDGPVAPWDEHDVAALLGPLVAHVRARHAFAVRIGPALPLRSWEAATVRAAIADGQARSLPEVAPDGEDPLAVVVQHLRDLGWRRVDDGAEGFAAGQPRFRFELPVDGGLDAVHARLAPQWRRNIRTADRLGVDVREGAAGDLATFHELYVATARRDGFMPRPLEYFARLLDALGPACRLHVAYRGAVALAAGITVRAGDRCTYLYGGSSDGGRELKGSNALQWRMIADAVTSGAAVYDLRGIGGSLDPAEPLFGLTRFKLGSGGRAVETVGEWELPVRRLASAAVGAYLRRR